jgi:hypothetical protein
MAAQYNNNGIISKNDRKTQENHPDIRGSATVDGVEYWVAGWDKTSTKGAYYSLAFTLKDGQQPNSKNAGSKSWDDTKTSRPASAGLSDGDIPF